MLSFAMRRRVLPTVLLRPRALSTYGGGGGSNQSWMEAYPLGQSHGRLPGRVRCYGFYRAEHP